MMPWLTEPFEADVVLRALVAGVIASCLCALVGCWVLLRRSVFLSEAMTHGMLPGVALAALAGDSLMAGGLIAALVMAVGVALVGRSSKLSSDTSTGLLLVGMLALGVIIVSRSQSFAVDLTGFLFGDVFAVRTHDLVVLAAALVRTIGAVMVGHRAFVAVTFDPRKAATLGLRPQWAIPALTALIAVAMVASFHVVGTLLVLGLLIAPPATALTWVSSIPRAMLLSAVIGSAAVYLGLVISWHAGTAGGATIAVVALLMFFLSALLSLVRTNGKRISIAAASACVVAGCAGGTPPPTPQAPATQAPADDIAVEGAEELDGPLTKLVLVDPATGDTEVYDAVEETGIRIGSYGPVAAVSGDGRFAYLQTDDGTPVVDAGAWTFDHGEHYHYFATEPSLVGTLDVPVVTASASNSLVAIGTANGAVDLLDREELGERSVIEPDEHTVGDDVVVAVPYGNRVVTASDAGRLGVIDAGGATELAGECAKPLWGRATRRAVVIGCDTGAVRVTGGDGDLTVTTMPFPSEAPAGRPNRMDHRDRSMSSRACRMGRCGCSTAVSGGGPSFRCQMPSLSTLPATAPCWSCTVTGRWEHSTSTRQSRLPGWHCSPAVFPSTDRSR